jgi:hypothetical protein
MHFLPYLILLIVLLAIITCAFYLFKNITRENIIVSFAGLFLFALGSLLLMLDIILVAITHGPQHISDYLIFNRLVTDTGFSGRWVFTSYVFIGTGFLIFLYVAAIKLIKKIK